MALDHPTPEEKLTPEARRTMLRAFGDRMLIKLSAMGDPEDLPGVERAVRAAAAIERLYSRCDRAETHAPDPRKLEAERARNTADAIKARVHLAQDLQWGEKRRQKLGTWWDAAETRTDAQTQVLAAAPGLPEAAGQMTASASAASTAHPNTATPAGLKANYLDRVAAIAKMSTDLGLNDPDERPGCDPPP